MPERTKNINSREDSLGKFYEIMRTIMMSVNKDYRPDDQQGKRKKRITIYMPEDQPDIRKAEIKDYKPCMDVKI